MLKRNSRLALKGRWGHAILVLLLPALASLLLTLTGTAANILLLDFWVTPDSGGLAAALLQVPLPSLLVTLVLWVAGFFLLSPLQMGTAYWFYSLVNGKSLPVRQVFRWFGDKRRYWRSVGYGIHIMARSFFWALLFLLIPVTLTASSLLVLSLGGERTVMAFGTVGLSIACALTLLAVTICTIYLGRYFLAAYRLCEDEGVNIRAAFRDSVEYTQGYRFNYFLYTLSFAGWMLLCVLTLGIAALYLAPYLSASGAMYGRYVTEKSRIQPADSTKEFIVNNQQTGQSILDF